ncbi:MAG: hypothetical protein JW718_08330 [Desulfovibrionaceae bacterium]|nr:hypothetical protein [Desulfovibrionaceae bacterium]
MRLDLRSAGAMSPEALRAFGSLARELRGPFTGFVSGLGAKFGNSLLWSLSTPASRHCYFSPLFVHCCGLVLLKRLVDSGRGVSEIASDSSAFCGLVRHWLRARGLGVRVTGPGPDRREGPARRLGRALRALLTELAIRASIRRGSGPGPALPDRPLTLVDTFALPGFVEDDRYFGELVNHLDAAEAAGVFFAPTFTGFTAPQAGEAARRLRRSGRNVIFKERFLKVRDYFWAWFSSLRTAFLRLDAAGFASFDLAPLIREELRGLRGLGSTMTAFLNHRFAMRLARAGVKLGLVLDWWENQSIDRGWNAGFSEFYPGVRRVGYLGFPPYPMLLCLYPSSAEKQAGVLPDEIAVIGPGLVPGLAEFCPGLKVFAGPALRFGHVFEPPARSERNGFTILASLPISGRDAAAMLEMIARAGDHGLGPARLLVKPHPACPWPEVPEGMELVEGDFARALDHCDMLVCMGSSVGLEALAKGVPVALAASPGGLSFNPIPDSVDPGLWRLCFDGSDLAEAARLFRAGREQDPDLRLERARAVRDRFFTPVNRETVRRLLDPHPEGPS